MPRPPANPPRRTDRVAVFVLLFAVSCGEPGEENSADNPDRADDGAAASRWAFEKEFPGGAHPVTLVMRLDRTSLSLSGQLTLEEELRIEAGFESEFPEYLPEDFEGFSVSDINLEGLNAPTSDSPNAASQKRVLRKRLVLEPERSGDLAIAPLAVYFHASGEAEEASFLSEEIPIVVEGIEDIGAVAVRPMRDIFETPPDEEASHSLVWTVSILGAVILLALGAIWLRRRPRRTPPPVPAHETAYDALRRLVALGLVEKGEIELFFVHLSGILRGYIENRFHVHAPERTTEEFLDETSRNVVLERHRDRLGEFLALSDQVKFARFEPDEGMIQRAFDVLKEFIEETRVGGDAELPTVEEQPIASTAGGAP